MPLLLVLIVLSVAVLGIAGWILVDELLQSPSAAVVPASPAETTARAEPPPVAPATASRPALAAASSAAPPAPPASAAAAEGETPACPTAPSEEGQSLLTYQGYLIVCAPESLDVYVSGIRVGKTNEKLVARCHLKYVRLAEGDPPTWRSEGRTVDIACRDVTRIDIEPTP
ncbi:MAG: hypothetical protein ACOC1F_00690 [Myxococcota bacterium]